MFFKFCYVLNENEFITVILFHLQFHKIILNIKVNTIRISDVPTSLKEIPTDQFSKMISRIIRKNFVEMR